MYYIRDCMVPAIYKAIQERRVEWTGYNLHIVYDPTIRNSPPYANRNMYEYITRFIWGGFLIEYKYKELFESPFLLTIVSGEPNEEYLVEYLKVIS